MQIATIGNQPTMSTREIAELLEKRHDNIKLSAERLSARGVIGSPSLQETTYTDPQNKQTYTEYLLSKRDSLILVAQNCPEFTARIVDRWQELEGQQTPAVPQTFAAALRLAAEQAEKIEAQALLLERQQPAVEFVDRFVEAKSAKGFREVAKILGVPEREFIKSLAEQQIIFKQGASWLPMAEHQKNGRFTVKTGESNGHAFTQTRFTPEGIAWIAKRVAKRGAK
jgi:phage antirepressor YoqD-like protein